MLEVPFSSLAITSTDANTTSPLNNFFVLPFELRSKILSYVLTYPTTIDLDPTNYSVGQRRLNLFLVSQDLNCEASEIFYSKNTFRIFPTHSRFFGHKTVPLLARLPAKCRPILTSLELRLGPGWSNPPKSWRVDSRLGLEDMVKVRTLKVFVECDPSHDIFKGFRVGRDYFTDFSARLLEGIMDRLPALITVEFDAWPSVMREGPLMRKLVQVAKAKGKKTIEITGYESFEKRMIVHMSRPRHVE